MLSGYTYESTIPIAAGASGLGAGAVIYFNNETAVLIKDGKCRADRRDYRVVYNGTEIDRVMITTGGIAFRLQAPLGSNETTTAYKINYGKADESTSPAENPRNVWSAYYDGSADDLASLTKTGLNVSAFDFPKHGLIKCGLNPVLTRKSGTFNREDIREVNFFDDTAASGYYIATYDTTGNGSQGCGYSRSTDLFNWEDMGAILPAGGTGGMPSLGGGDLIISKFSWSSTYYGTFVVAHSVDSNGIGMPPYELWGATASNAAGPWTVQGKLLAVGGAGAIDNLYCVDGEIISRDGGTTYYIVYGAASDIYGQSAALAYSTAGPMGPYTKAGALFNSGGENPRIRFDDNYAYIWVNPIANLYGCRTDIMYWADKDHWTDPAYWNINLNTTKMIEPTEDAWDDYIIGVAGSPVFKTGMIYVGYDGCGHDNYVPANPHKFRDGGLVEAPWPFVWGKAIRVGASSTAQTPSAILSGAGEIHIRIKCDRQSSGFTVSGGGESYVITSTESQDPDYPDYVYGSFSLAVNGSGTSWLTNGMADNNVGDMKTWKLKRASNGQLSIWFQGVLAWQSAVSASTGNLSVTANAGTTLEAVLSFGETRISAPVTETTTVNPANATGSISHLTGAYVRFATSAVNPASAEGSIDKLVADFTRYMNAEVRPVSAMGTISPLVAATRLRAITYLKGKGNVTYPMYIKTQ